MAVGLGLGAVMGGFNIAGSYDCGAATNWTSACKRKHAQEDADKQAALNRAAKTKDIQSAMPVSVASSASSTISSVLLVCVCIVMMVTMA